MGLMTATVLLRRARTVSYTHLDVYKRQILADEPTGNLDPESSEEIFKLLHHIAQTECAVFLVTHNYQLVKKYPARTFRCEDGLISEIQETEIDFNSLLD